MYVPTHGSTGMHRSAGPLDKDVSAELKELDENDYNPHELKTKELALEAAENSAMEKLQQIQEKRSHESERKRVDAEFKIHPPKITGWKVQTFFIFTPTWGKKTSNLTHIFPVKTTT